MVELVRASERSLCRWGCCFCVLLIGLLVLPGCLASSCPYARNETSTGKHDHTHLPSITLPPSLSALLAKPPFPLPPKGTPEYLNHFVKANELTNELLLGPFIPLDWRAQMPHVVHTYLRNLISGTVIYFATGGLWVLYVYWLKGQYFFPDGAMPKADDVLKQIRVSMVAMPLYVMMPVISEYMIEQGWTKSYISVDEVGWVQYLLLSSLYMVVVEFGVYWMHRGLHDMKWAYKWLHATHHNYNKQNTLSPFAGLAFHPLDGMLQASPYLFALYLVPMHFFTHELLLFMTAVWTTNIHDCIDGKVWPVMGAGYHTIHHTTYKHNYGHYTVWMDWMFGTLRDPPNPTPDTNKSKVQ